MIRQNLGQSVNSEIPATAKEIFCLLPGLLASLMHTSRIWKECWMQLSSLIRTIPTVWSFQTWYVLYKYFNNK